MEAAENRGMPAEGGKGPLGLTTVSQPISLPLADVIFIHGLGGGSRKTWSYSPGLEHFWPQMWLASDPEFANVRIHSFGYAADWTKTEKNIYRITDFAYSLLNQISNHPTIGQGSNGIVLCGHSLGGCVAKMAYILARQEPLKADISRRISSMIFLGTPHRGSDLAKILSRILSVSLGSKPFVKSLTLDSAELKEINDRFQKHAGSVRLWSFYETQPVKMFGFGSVVVEPHSATLGFSGEETTPLHADHRQICKFKSSNDPNYKTIRNTILTAVNYAQSQQRQNRGARLRRFLQIQSMPEDDFHTLRMLRQPGSCEWLLHRKPFTSWAAGRTDCPPIFWLTAMPGSGKSVLSSHVLDTLDSWSHTVCSAFTFQNAKSETSAFSECLRSLAYQMAQEDPEVLKRLIRLEEEAVTWNLRDELHVWRKLFVENIFGIPSLSRHVWVIDGLDECANLPAVFTKQLLSNAPSSLRIFITSRPVETINRGIRALGSRVSPYQLTLEDTADDIAAVVMAGLDALGILEDEHEKAAICDIIFRRSRGMFLWVRLVLQELESAAIWSKEHIDIVLSEIPDGLSQLYARCLKSVLRDRRTLKLIKPILTWATLGSRSLTTQEIQSAVKLDAHESLLNAEHAIPSICAQLLSVDKGKMVHTIHETFHEFLLSEDCPHAIRVDKARSHSRIATLLLQYLAGKHMRPVIREDSTYFLQGSRSKADMTLVDYAARCFSDHISESDPADGELLNSLCRFLESDGVLAWMALAATDKDTLRLAKVATHLGDYLDRRLQIPSMDAADSRHDLIWQWSTDLFRFSCKYGPQLATSPGSFFDLIPSLCPLDTAITKAFERFMPSILYRALRAALLPGWSPALATTECEGITTTAHGHNLFAGLRGHSVGIYDQKSALWLLDIPLPTRSTQGTHLLSMAFSFQDEYIAVYDSYHILVFEPLTGALIYDYSLETKHPEAESKTTLIFAAANRLVLATAKRLVHIEWEDRPGDRDIILETLLPTKGFTGSPLRPSGVELATDGDRSIVAFKDPMSKSETILVWDSEKDEIIGEFSFNPEDWNWGRYPRGPDGYIEHRVIKEETLSSCPMSVLGWINPSLDVPVLALLGLQGENFKLGVIDYSSGTVLHHWPPQPFFIDTGVPPIVSASFSGDGSAFGFLHQDLIYIYIFSTEDNGSVRVATLFLHMDIIYDELRPTANTEYQIGLSFDGSRFTLSSKYTLSTLVFPRKFGFEKGHHMYNLRSIYKKELIRDETNIPLPTKAGQGGSCLVGYDYHGRGKSGTRISLVFTLSLRTVIVWNPDLYPVDVKCHTNLVTNDERSRAVWECERRDAEGPQSGCVEFVVADLTPKLTQLKEGVDGQDLPALHAILRQVVGSPCKSLLLNKSGDRLIRRTKDDCELWELPSGVKLATWNLWEFWGFSGPGKYRDGVALLPLIQHPTDPDWLLCVNAYMPRQVALLSWRDFTLSMGSADAESEIIPCGNSAQPPTESPVVCQPVRPDLLTALLHGLEALVPVPAAYDSYNAVWKACFWQYLRACAVEDPCFRTVYDFFSPRIFIPIAFLSASRTLVFLTTDLWIYSMQVVQYSTLPSFDEARPQRPQALPRRPPWRSGSGVYAPSCGACGQSHPIRARRHIYTNFMSHQYWQCFWADGGTAVDGRKKMDFSFWGAEPTDRVIVTDALRYADEVEWVEYRNENGQVWKREWKLVEGESLGGDAKTGRAV